MACAPPIGATSRAESIRLPAAPLSPHAPATTGASCPLTPPPLSSSALQDRHEFSQLVTAIRQQYNENAKAIERGWGGGIMGVKSQAATSKTEKALAKEMAKKAMM